MKRHEIIFALRAYTSHAQLTVMLDWSDSVLAKLLGFYKAMDEFNG